MAKPVCGVVSSDVKEKLSESGLDSQGSWEISVLFLFSAFLFSGGEFFMGAITLELASHILWQCH